MHDDDRGIGQTYTYYPHTTWLVQLFASSWMFILVVDTVVASALAGLAANAVGAQGAVIAIATGAAGTCYFVAWTWHFTRRITAWERQYVALFPHSG